MEWQWLIAKLEKRFQSWNHKWLSRAGKLVLIKSILEAIPDYWISIAWIKKGILEKARQLCFKFLWRGHKDHFVMPWIRWERIAIRKPLGGWGSKTFFYFRKRWLQNVCEGYWLLRAFVHSRLSRSILHQHLSMNGSDPLPKDRLISLFCGKLVLSPLMSLEMV